MVVPGEPWCLPCLCLCPHSVWHSCLSQTACLLDGCQHPCFLLVLDLCLHIEVISAAGTFPSCLCHCVGSVPNFDDSSNPSPDDVKEEHTLCPDTPAMASGIGCIHLQMLLKSFCSTCTSRARKSPWFPWKCGWSNLRPSNGVCWVCVELHQDLTSSVSPCQSCEDTRKVSPLPWLSSAIFWLMPWWWKIHTSSQRKLNGIRCNVQVEGHQEGENEIYSLWQRVVDPSANCGELNEIVNKRPNLMRSNASRTSWSTK